MEWNKVHLINELAGIHGHRSYLEICTPTTGNMYAQVDRSRYVTCHRLMSRCDDGFDDGLPIEVRVAGDDIEAAVRELQAKPLRYDTILVDPFHEYETSKRGLLAALQLVAANGTIVVHDCFPRDEAIAQPRSTPGAWCGVTYKAYLDVVLGETRVGYCTVDTDYGCGMMRWRSQAATPEPGRTFGDSADDAVAQWRRLGDDYAAAFKLLQAYPQPLLRLVTVDEFLAGERCGQPLC